MQTYAITRNNGKVMTLTRALSKLEPDWVAITDPNIALGDFIDTTTGELVSKAVPDTNESKKQCKELVRQILRDCDWTQATDNLGVGKQNDWKVYRQAVRDAWAIAKTANDPMTAMVWPVPPGDASDGL